MEDITKVNNDNGSLSFEDFKNQNGITYWWATDLMTMLGYKDLKSFQKVLDRTTKAFVALNIPHYENIIAVNTEDGYNFKMTRFACYMAVMNADSKKTEVAAAQVYFAQQTRKFELYLQNNEEIERIVIREELTEGNKSLASVAKQHDVADYAKFQNAGYLGMYNMESWKLEKKRNVKKGKLADYMGRTELAANLFRITQTEERIKNKNITGQKALEQTHYNVGREVRNIIVENVGKAPENLTQQKELPNVKKELKEGYKKMNQEDSPSDKKKSKK
ncbi:MULTISPECIES: BRO family protein [unclassified Dysgonomonas]|uniref:BRO family protein n=1 Tax=unclassified Dysgonomonas TaxID=2630389 RepID=UPI0025BA076C|nr:MULTISPECIES: BRO family protein [unclassified Dysgonomonas]HMM02046.1 damage-inducible protein [Dysgonomonas sp.]